jgi:hypothetical protein
MEKTNFRMQPAYSGAPVFFRYWGKTIIETPGLHYPGVLPALRQHAPDRNVGVISQVSLQNHALHASGTFLEASADGKEVAALARAGYPWQASISFSAETIEIFDPGETVVVNGQLLEGPLTVVRQGRLREISFVGLGLDPDTAVLPMAAPLDTGGGIPAGKQPTDFMEAVKLAFRQGAPGPRAAIKRAAAAWPGLYRAHLEAIGHAGGYPDIMADNPARAGDFEDKVRDLMADGRTRGEATKMAARDFPQLHAQYIARLNQ